MGLLVLLADRFPPPDDRLVRIQGGHFMDMDHSNAVDIAIPQESPSRPYYAIEAPIACWRKDRHTAVAEAAYFHAERRGFAPGHELEDWLAGECEFEERLISEGRQF